MGKYLEKCEKCGDETITYGWYPERCPFCELAEAREKLAKAINDYETAVLREHRMQEQRDIAIEAIKEIMANEEGLHRMGYNPYLISYGAMKKIKSYNETKG